jgi:hypothetical protein
MASKKPAKRNITNAPEKVKEVLGKAVMYIGLKGAEPFHCPTCKRQLIKGIVYEYNSNSYCKRTCIPSTENKG